MSRHVYGEISTARHTLSADGSTPRCRDVYWISWHFWDFKSVSVCGIINEEGNVTKSPDPNETGQRWRSWTPTSTPNSLASSKPSTAQGLLAVRHSLSESFALGVSSTSHSYNYAHDIYFNILQIHLDKSAGLITMSLLSLGVRQLPLFHRPAIVVLDPALIVVSHHQKW